MKLQKASLFALYAVLELAAEPGRQLSATDIADKYGISTHHLAKVMRQLVRAGLVQAVRGVGGGYRFAGNINRTTLLDVIELFERLDTELDVPAGPRVEALPIVAELQTISSEIDDLARSVLESITLKTALAHAHERTAAPRAPAVPVTRFAGEEALLT